MPLTSFTSLGLSRKVSAAHFARYGSPGSRTVSAISSTNQDLLDAIELSLSEQLFDDPSTTIVPLVTEATEGEDEEQA